MALTRTLTAGIAGFGRMGRRHLDALTRAGGVEVVAIADHHRQPAGPAWYRSLDELLACHRPDLVVVSLPARAHHDAVLSAISAGVSCVVDKPFCVTTEEAASLQRASRQSGAFVAVAHTERWSLEWRRLRAAVVDGRSPVRVFRAVRMGPKPSGIDIGPALDLAVHDADLARDLLGELTPVAGRDGDGTVDIELRSAGGVEVHLRAGWSPTVVRTIEVETDDATLTADLRPDPTSIDAMYTDVIGALRSGGPPPIGPDDGAGAVTAVLAASRVGSGSW